MSMKELCFQKEVTGPMQRDYDKQERLHYDHFKRLMTGAES